METALMFSVNPTYADKLRSLIDDANQWGFDSTPWDAVIDSLVTWLEKHQEPQIFISVAIEKRIEQLSRLTQSLESCASRHSCNSEILWKYAESLAEIIDDIKEDFDDLIDDFHSQSTALQ